MPDKTYIFDDNYIKEKKWIPIVSYCTTYINHALPHNIAHMHYHSDFEIIYIKTGKVKMLVDEKEVVAKDGEMILINPYETHFGELLTPDLVYYCIDFDSKLLPLNDKNVKYSNHVKGDFESYIKNINNAYTEETPGWELEALGNLMLMFSKLHNHLVLADSKNDNTFTKNVLNYLSQNYSGNTTSKTAATILGYDQSYFCRVFKKCFGMKYSDYLNIYRIKKAKEFLKTENISTTAILAGFSSISYFSATFKNITGISPTQYKKQL